MKRKGVVARGVRRKRGTKLRLDEQEPDKRLLEFALKKVIHFGVNPKSWTAR